MPDLRILKVVFLLLMLLMSITDILTKRIPTSVLLGCLVLGIFGNADNAQMGEWGMIGASLLPGVFFLLLSRLFQNAIGIGDGLVLLGIGSFLGLGGVMFTLSIALLAASFYAGALLVFFKKRRKDKIPFLPFLTLGYIASLAVCS